MKHLTKAISWMLVCLILIGTMTAALLPAMVLTGAAANPTPDKIKDGTLPDGATVKDGTVPDGPTLNGRHGVRALRDREPRGLELFCRDGCQGGDEGYALQVDRQHLHERVSRQLG